MIDIATASLAQVLQALQSGQATPVALTEAYLARIDRLDGRLNSYLTVTADLARAAAGQSERRRREGRPLGPLDGLPVALKDLLDVAGAPTTNGLGALRDNVARDDAEVTRRLRAAGAVILGKLNMHEAALGASNDNPFFGPCHNPWRLDCSPGGSSGGSGAAVAAGLCAAALGTDNLGSVRIPSALCGIAGLKPTNGLVSVRGMMQLSWSTATIGPMARGVEGLAALMAVLAGADPDCEDSEPAQPALDFALPPAYSLRGTRVGVLPPLVPAAHEPAVLAAFEAALRVLAAQGATVRPVALPELEHARLQGLLIIEAEGAVAAEALLERDPPVFSAEVKGALDYGRRMAAPRLVRAWRVRTRLRHRVLRLLAEQADVLAAPTAPVAAFPIAQGAPDDIAANLALANLCGLPALSVPMGYDAAGLPLGLQLIGPPFGDAAVLRAGLAYERATDWHLGRPPLEDAPAS
jgi:aspartyl-tRNA(Asn)/glutamyl-tRNA(Gln) amidotransferase subunit A